MDTLVLSEVILKVHDSIVVDKVHIRYPATNGSVMHPEVSSE